MSNETETEFLKRFVEARKVNPYTGWNITELNKLNDEVREYFGLPSVEDLNPDIKSMRESVRSSNYARQKFGDRFRKKGSKRP